MKTLRSFKISENSKNFDVVSLLVDEDKFFYVIYKWTTMREAKIITFKSFEEAKEKYLERKRFAIFCN